MEIVVGNTGKRVKRVVENGREWIVRPLSMIVPGTLAGSKGPLYYPPDETGKATGAWDGIPIVVYHPVDKDGNHVSANSDGIFAGSGIGWVRKPAYKNKLVAEGWFDVRMVKNYDAKLKALDRPLILPRLERGEPIELSTGLFTDSVQAPPGYKDHKGRPYSGLIARNHRPDHLAILPDQRGACSVDDGCGVSVNEERRAIGNHWFEGFLSGITSSDTDSQETYNTQINQPRSMVSGRYKQMNSGTGKGDAHEAAQAGAVMLTDRDWELGKLADGTDLSRPEWVADEDKWLKARMASDKGGFQEETYWAVAAHIYQRLGGKVVERDMQVTNDNHSLKGDTDMVAKFNKPEAVRFLTTNCDCWRGQEEVLNSLPDKQLAELHAESLKHQENEAVANAARAGLKALFPDARDEQLTANAMPAFIEEKKAAMDEEADKEDGLAEGNDDAEIENSKKSTTNKRKESAAINGNSGAKKMTAKEWFAAMPDEARPVWNTAIEINSQVKQSLVGRLVANVKDEKLKARLIANHSKKDISVLRDEVAALAALTGNQDRQQYQPTLYLPGGEMGIAPVANTDPDDYLDIPVYNQADWDKMTGRAARQTA